MTRAAGWLVALVIGLAVLPSHRSVAAGQRGGTQGAPLSDCRHLFDAPQDGFDATKAAAVCKREAPGSAEAMYRLGLLTLAGLGTPRDLEAAAKLCADAHARDPQVPSGFCIAAAATALQRADAQTDDLPAPPAAPSRDAADAQATIGQLEQASNQGRTEASADLCGIYFEGRGGRFEPVQVAAWCRRAAAFGDPQALVRVGLMRLWGVGTERSLPGAEALCSQAMGRGHAALAAFCLAAIAEDRKITAATYAPSVSVYPAPFPAAPNRGVASQSLAADRVLETVHTTATGLHYTCRDLGRWGRYGQVLDPLVFGRKIETFTDRDYTALGEAAEACSTAIAAFDPQGGEQALLLSFRQALPELKLRQRELAAATASGRIAQAELTREQAALSRRVVIAVPSLSSPQQTCLNAIQRSWAGRGVAFGTLEINSARTDSGGKDDVVTGEGQTLTPSAEAISRAYTFSCTVRGHGGGELLHSSLTPSEPVAASGH